MSALSDVKSRALDMMRHCSSTGSVSSEGRGVLGESRAGALVSLDPRPLLPVLRACREEVRFSIAVFW